MRGNMLLDDGRICVRLVYQVRYHWFYCLVFVVALLISDVNIGEVTICLPLGRWINDRRSLSLENSAAVYTSWYCLGKIGATV